MRKIVKSAEPVEWTAYRRTPGVGYQAIPELRQSLLEEQGYICAYCMRRIPHRDNNSSENCRIDHILSRKRHDDLKFSYQNMIACCPGAINQEFHCDKLKGENDITFDLSDDSFIHTLSYQSKSGEIKSSNKDYQEEINDLLNLNHSLIRKNRQQTLQGVITRLGQRTWKVSDIRKTIENWDNNDNEGRYKPYNGIVLWYLKKKINHRK